MITWALICLAMAIGFFLLEIFLPTGGVAGFLSAASVIGFVVLLFQQDQTLGLVAAALVLLAMPPAVAIALKFWPETRIARMMRLTTPVMSEAALRGDAAVEDNREAQRMVGHKGKTVTVLRPVGVCIIDGQRYDCIAEEGTIAANRTVVVVEAEVMQLKVREAIEPTA